jgi:hypothetical protein
MKIVRYESRRYQKVSSLCTRLNFQDLIHLEANHQMLKTNIEVLKEASDSVVEKLYRLKNNSKAN